MSGSGVVRYRFLTFDRSSNSTSEFRTVVMGINQPCRALLALATKALRVSGLIWPCPTAVATALTKSVSE